ncbi:MAG: tetratricopeptide repeat protein [Bacteroidota bacterium]
MIRIVSILTFILLAFTSVFTQNKIDSLFGVIDRKNDSIKVDALIKLAVEYYKINADTSLIFSAKALNLADKLNYKKGISDAYQWKAKANNKLKNYDKSILYSFKSIEIRKVLKDTLGLARSYSNAGISYAEKNEYDSALICQKKCLEQYLLLPNEKKSTAIAYNNIGSALINLGNYKEAIIAFKNSMELFNEIDFQDGVASCLLNIGQIYDQMGNKKDTIQNNKALDYFQKALAIYIDNDNQFKIGETYNAIGIQYDQKATQYFDIAKQTDSIHLEKIILQKDIYKKLALENLEKGSLIFSEIEYALGIAQITNNIGTIYMNSEEFDDALKYLNNALKTNIELNNREEIATNLGSIAECYRRMKKYELALEHLDKGFEMVNEVRTPYLYLIYYQEYSIVNDSIKNFKDAFKYYKLFTSYKDSLLRADNLTTINEVQALYENEMKEKQLQLSEAEVREQKIVANKRKQQTYGLAVIALLFLISAGVILRSLQHKKRSNKILAAKNELITFQKQEITDSITYAGRIQKAVLPQVELAETLFKDYFILFKPQHIVSGDFYWIKEFKHSDIVVATAADCTGHGVPGAFMSMLGLSFLNEIVNKPEVKSAADVLNQLRENVISALHQTGKEGEQKDGMDISLIAWHRTENYVEFAGANNPLYFIRSGELIEYKGDKMPIGIHIKADDFSCQKIEVQEGDCIYMFSDGFADQFGGPNGKKFKYKPFKQIFLDNADKSMSEQKLVLDNTIEEWKSHINRENGIPYQQIDDIVVVGLRF